MTGLTQHRKPIAALAIALVLSITMLGEAFAQGVPVIPALYSGTASLTDGTPVPDGYTILAIIEGKYESRPVPVRNGRYDLLEVSGDSTARGREIKFFLGDVPAVETDTLVAQAVNLEFNLTFAKLPEPTPTPTPEGGAPTPAPIVPPTPVPVSTVPLVASPMTYATGLVIITNGVLPESPVLTAKVGALYESAPAVVTSDGSFGGLVVNPMEVGLIGQPVEFYLNGKQARTTDTYESGAVRLQFDIVFTAQFATATAVPTEVPPTPTRVPPTPVPPTPVPPTPTEVPPTAVPPTPVPPPTAVPPTATPAPTATSVPPQPTATSRPVVPSPPREDEEEPDEEASGSSCGSMGPVSPWTGGANLALLLAPIGLAFGLRRLRISAPRE